MCGSDKLPQYPKQNSKLKSSNPNRQKEDLEREADKICQENERSKGESESLARDHEKLKWKALAVREEYECAMADLEIAKAQREKLQKDAGGGEAKSATHSRRERGKSAEQPKGEAESAKQENIKLKGKTRAIRVEYEKAKGDLKAAKERKEKLEKSALAAREKKAQYEKEAKAIKAALDSCKTEMGQPVQRNLPKRESAEETKSNNSDGPAKKKRKTGNQSGKSVTITKSMKVDALQEEALARGMSANWLSGMIEKDLLEHLVVGSPCITDTDTWRALPCLGEKFEAERQEHREREPKRQRDLQAKREKKRREREKKTKAEQEKERAAEKSSQAGKRTHRFEAVHHCKLAKTAGLLRYGLRRFGDCSECRQGVGFYTCEKCNYDICQNCFEDKTMTPAEKKAEAKRKAALEKKRREEEGKEEEEQRKKWDAKIQFKPEITCPPKRNLDPDGNRKEDFTVWCSEGYGRSRWHDYEGQSRKEFDSAFRTKEEANERARHLFHWKNPWGLESESIGEEEEVDKSPRDGLGTYVATPPDSTTWTVGVVPDAAYVHMENVTLMQHGNDDDGSDLDDCSIGIGY